MTWFVLRRLLEVDWRRLLNFSQVFHLWMLCAHRHRRGASVPIPRTSVHAANCLVYSLLDLTLLFVTFRGSLRRDLRTQLIKGRKTWFTHRWRYSSFCRPYLPSRWVFHPVHRPQPAKWTALLQQREGLQQSWSAHTEKQWWLCGGYAETRSRLGVWFNR